MTVPDIIQQRLANQWLTGSPAQEPKDVVRQLLAVQAQDYLGSLWAIGQRMPEGTEQAVEAEISNGTIIRTWPMRGTLHFVCAEDARWLVPFLAHRVIPKTRSIFKKAGLDDSILKKSRRIVTKALEKDTLLTRRALYDLLDNAGISTADTRGLHITGHLAMNGLICFGPRKGKEHTFTLMDQWLPPAPPLVRDEVLPMLATRYFKGHGPATARDFAWWTGLNLTEARHAISLAGSLLVAENAFEDVFYTCAPHNSVAPLRKAFPVHLLPAFDEFTVAYKDRQFILPGSERHRGGMDVLRPVMSMNGMLTGTWRRTLTGKKVIVNLVRLPAFNRQPDRNSTNALRRIKIFLALTIRRLRDSFM